MPEQPTQTITSGKGPCPYCGVFVATRPGEATPQKQDLLERLRKAATLDHDNPYAEIDHLVECCEDAAAFIARADLPGEGPEPRPTGRELRLANAAIEFVKSADPAMHCLNDVIRMKFEEIRETLNECYGRTL